MKDIVTRFFLFSLLLSWRPDYLVGRSGSPRKSETVNAHSIPRFRICFFQETAELNLSRPPLTKSKMFDISNYVARRATSLRSGIDSELREFSIDNNVKNMI